MTQRSAEVGIIMGSQSDWPTMKHAADVLDELGVAYEAKIVSAHRTPERLVRLRASPRQTAASRSSSPAPAAPRICPA